MLESYLSSRRFQSPYLMSTEAVSPLSALWAFLLGPFYYWRKRAPVEAIIFGLAMAAVLLLDDDLGLPGTSDGIDIGWAIWLCFALAAPVLLPACYRRKGWNEVAREPIRGHTLDRTRALSQLEE